VGAEKFGKGQCWGQKKPEKRGHSVEKGARPGQISCPALLWLCLPTDSLTSRSTDGTRKVAAAAPSREAPAPVSSRYRNGPGLL